LMKLLSNKNITFDNDRVKKVSEYLKWKKILNIWCLNHSLEWFNFNPQHNELKSQGGQLVIWVDILEEAKKLWDWIEIWNIEDEYFINKLLEKYWKFDIVFAGELIEHLQDYVKFFKQAKKFLNEDWYVIISTPNPFWLHYFLSNFRNWYLKQWNADHKFWIDIFQLIENIREDFELVDFSRVSWKWIYYKFIKLLKKPQLCMNYLAIFKIKK
jgi:2-polyprenyl-3-methyl-5-hydroxy-6-metoxy-1,4-benzoquinol methylase